MSTEVLLMLLGAKEAEIYALQRQIEALTKEARCPKCGAVHECDKKDE